MTRSFQPPERQLLAVAICRPESFVRGIGRAVLSASLTADCDEIRSLTIPAPVLPGVSGRLAGRQRSCVGLPAIFTGRGRAGFVNFCRRLAGSSFRAFVKHSPKSLGVRAVLLSPFLSWPFIHAEQSSMENEAWRTQKQGI